MSEKKHKSGYVLLKEKYTALKAERDELQKDLDFALEKAKKERDEWKEKCNKWKSTAVTHLTNYDMERYMRYGLEEELAFLLDHCPFLVRWLYKRKFEKGE